jgi:DNA-binding NarL/FixJ family response regulator
MPNRPTNSSPAPARIVVVDDHKILREGLRRLLGDQSDLVVVGEAADSETAWRLAGELTPDLMLMDLDLPGEGGAAVTRRIRATYPGIKVLVVTGQLQAHYARDALQAGAAGYLLKTDGASEILGAIRAVLAGSIYLSAETTAVLAQLDRRLAPGATGSRFSEREMEVLQLIVAGKRNKEISADLKIGIKSVETYRARLMKKAACGSPAELVRFAIREGLAGA